MAPVKSDALLTGHLIGSEAPHSDCFQFLLGHPNTPNYYIQGAVAPDVRHPCGDLF